MTTAVCITALLDDVMHDVIKVLQCVMSPHTSLHVITSRSWGAMSKYLRLRPLSESTGGCWGGGAAEGAEKGNPFGLNWESVIGR